MKKKTKVYVGMDVHKDCTICPSCHWSISDCIVSRQRENRNNWRERGSCQDALEMSPSSWAG